MNFQKNWDSWGWVLATGAVVLVLVLSVAGREPFCAINEHCLREWVSASGSWVAVFVAVPSVLFLARQIKDAASFQRQNAHIAVRRNRAIAKRARRAALHLGFAAVQLEKAFADDAFDTKAAALGLRTLQRLAEDESLRLLESEIDLPGDHSLDHVMLRIRRAIKICDSKNPPVPANRNKWVLSVHDTVAEFSGDCIGVAKRYIRETDEMI